MKYSVNIKSSKNKKKKTSAGRRKSPSRKGDLSSKAINPSKLRGKQPRLGAKKKKKASYLGITKNRKNLPLKQRLGKFFVILLGGFFFLLIASLIGGGLYLRSIEASLPDPDGLVERDSAQTTVIQDRDGNELYQIYGEQNREFVELDELPDHFIWAVLAAEDIDFYEHKGLDLLAIGRAAYANLVRGEIVRGASTITQQLVRNTLLYDFMGDEAYEETYSRKIQEVLITMQVEQTLSKEEILQMYVNEVPFGGVNYGIQAASRAYFAKDAQDLTLAESAMLAGVIASPSNFSPIFGTDPELAERRQNVVLNLMERNKDMTGVTSEEIEEAKEEELEYAAKRVDIDAPHFVFYVKEELEEEFGIERVERGGLRVRTSLDYSIQEIAEEEIRQGIEQHGHQYNVQNGAMLVLDPHTNEILAMVGSIDYWEQEDPKIDGNTNVITSLRQMGSSVKPYTYLRAFEDGYGPWLQAPDIRGLDFGDYELRNWDHNYHGHMTAREALLKSRNIPAVYTTQLIGLDGFIETAEKLGITSLVHRDAYGLSLGLGAAEMKMLEHTAAFSVFANEGVKKPVVSILEVKDPRGEVLYENEDTGGDRVVDEKYAYGINWILCDKGNFGDQPLDHHYHIAGERVCGKTGTTDGPRDLTTIMYHRNLVVGVWAGNNNNVEVPGAWSTTVPLPIASSFMERVATEYRPEGFSRPGGVNSVRVCNDTGWMADEDTECNRVESIYMDGNSPPDDEREVIQVCGDSGLIPTNKELAEHFDLLEEKILFKDYEMENPLQEDNYKDYLRDLDDREIIFSEPDEGECELPEGATDSPIIDITSPVQGDVYMPGDTLDFEVDVEPGFRIEDIEVFFNGEIIKEETYDEDDEGDISLNFSYTLPDDLEDGDYSIRVAAFDMNEEKSSEQITVYIREEDDEEDD